MNNTDWRWKRLEGLADECGIWAQELHDIKVVIASLEAKIARQEYQVVLDNDEKVDGRNAEIRKAQIAVMVADDPTIADIRQELELVLDEEGEATRQTTRTSAMKVLACAAMNGGHDVAAELQIQAMGRELEELKQSTRNLYEATVTAENRSTPEFEDIAILFYDVVDGSADYAEPCADYGDDEKCPCVRMGDPGCQALTPEDIAEDEARRAAEEDADDITQKARAFVFETIDGEQIEVYPTEAVDGEDVPEDEREHDGLDCEWFDDPDAEPAMSVCMRCQREGCEHWLPF